MGVPTCPHVSVIVPTYNGMPLFKECLSSVLAQRAPWAFEVIVIDSGSTDGTWEAVGSLPVIRVQIPHEEFNHGATRNLGAQKARGDFLVFIVQDAVPRGDKWLATLVAAASTEGAAASYGRQVPQLNSHALSLREAEWWGADSSPRSVKRVPDGQTYRAMPAFDRFKLAVFADSCSCIRREIWARYPFARIQFGEDVEWAKRVLEGGYCIVYEPSAVVSHSHDRSAWYEFRRAYVSHYFANEIFGLTLIPTGARALRTTVWEIKDCWQRVFAGADRLPLKVRLLLWTPLFATARVTGQYLGARAGSTLKRYPWYRGLHQFFSQGV